MSEVAEVPSGTLLAIDTATEVATVALGDGHDRLSAVDRWSAGHLHSERILLSVQAVLDTAGSSLRDVDALVVGTGPGSFTGLRVGLAAAKGLAYGLGVPLVGVETAVALAVADPGAAPATLVVVVLPAGPGGRYRAVVDVSGPGAPHLREPAAIVAPAEALAVPPEGRLLVLDVPDASPEAIRVGEVARARLGETLLRLGAARLASRGPDDLAELVPAYVAPPRGAADSHGSITWSRSPD